MKSNLSEPGVKKETKKKVIWADEKNQSLVQTSFFEVDDSELAEMHLFARPSAMSNMSIAQLEKVMERDLRQRRDLQTENQDDKQTLAPLSPLIKILLPEHIHPATIVSQERLIQEEREKTVFQALLIRSFLPDSPAEPDQELSTERQEAKLIPLDDVRMNILIVIIAISCFFTHVIRINFSLDHFLQLISLSSVGCQWKQNIDIDMSICSTCQQSIDIQQNISLC